MPTFNQGYGILVDGQLHDEWGIRAGHKPDVSAGLVERICRKITDHARELRMWRNRGWTMPKWRLSLRKPGQARSASRQRSPPGRLKAGCLKIRILWPFPEKAIDQLCQE